MKISKRVFRAKFKHQQIANEKAAFKSFFAEAASIVFFTGSYLNRQPLKADRKLLTANGYKLIKVNNLRLYSALISSPILKSLAHSASVYSLLGYSYDVKNINEVETMFALKYNYLMPQFAINDKTLITKDRLVWLKKSSYLGNISATLKASNPGILICGIGTFLLNRAPNLNNPLLRK